MSLKRNILATYANQIYVSLIGIVMVPVYVRYMGLEAYGLVGFFAMLQAWFQLLDMGLTPTMARETARFNGGATDANSVRHLLRALEGIFFVVAIVIGVAMIAGSGAIARGWLNVQHLSLIEVRRSVALMGVIIGLRWICGLYRGAITGLEHLVWLAGFNIAVATARFVGVLIVLKYVGATPTIFFVYQLEIAVVEFAILVTQTYRLLPKAASPVPWAWEPLRSVLKFSLTLAFASSVWVLVTQTDKLVLSKLLPLSDYAYFTLAVLAASGVMLVSGPVSIALLPRLTKHSASGDEAELIRLYRQATQLVGVNAIPVALVLALFAQDVLWVWTGNPDIAQKAAPILALYALGNGILALGAFPFYLQFAKGDLYLHLIGSALFVVFLIPMLIWATFRFGPIGAGYAWLAANALYFVFWVPRVHKRFVPGLHSKWLRSDVAPIAALSLAGAVLIRVTLQLPHTRAYSALGIGVITLILFILAGSGSSWIRGRITTRSRGLA